MKKEKLISGLLILSFLLIPSVDSLAMDANYEIKIESSEINSSNTVNTKIEETTSTTETTVENKEEEKISSLSIEDYYGAYFSRDNIYEINGKRAVQYVQYYRDGIGQIVQDGQDGKFLLFISYNNEEVKNSPLIKAPDYRENLIGANEPTEVILKAPLKVKNSWVSMGNTYVIEDIIKDGATEIIKVSRKTSSGSDLLVFESGIGLKEVIVNGTTYLRFLGTNKLTKDTKETKLYFPKGNLVNTNIIFNTNDSVRDLLNETYKQVAKEKNLIEILGGASEIQFVYVEDGIVNVDLNDNFIAYINSNLDLEKEIINSLVNTLCDFYNAKGVKITINDQRYESKGQKIESSTILTKTN